MKGVEEKEESVVGEENPGFMYLNFVIKNGFSLVTYNLTYNVHLYDSVIVPVFTLSLEVSTERKVGPDTSSKSKHVLILTG